MALNEGVHAAVEHALELAVDEAGDMAPDMAVQAHGALVEALFAVPVEGDGGALDQGVAQQQELGQDGHDQQDGGEGATAKGQPHRADGGVGGDIADEEAGHRHNAAGGEHSGEALVQSLDHGLPAVHPGLEIQIAVGDDDGVVDGSAHLNGGDHQIAEEEHIGPCDSGEGEIDPDRPLDGQHQQNGESGGLKGKEQNDHDKKGGQNADFQVVAGEGAREVESVGGVAHQNHIVAVVGFGDGADLLQKGIGLVSLLGEIGHKDQTGPVFAPQLLESGVQGLLEVLHLPGLLSAQGDHALVLLL